MKLSEQIMDAIGELDESLLEKSERKRSGIDWKYSLAGVFAVIVLMLGIPLLYSKNFIPNSASGAQYAADSKAAETEYVETAAGSAVMEEKAEECFMVLTLRHASDDSVLREEELLAEAKRLEEQGFEVSLREGDLLIFGPDSLFESFEKNTDYTYVFEEESK